VVWISASGCAEDTRDMRAQYFWGFPLSTLPSSITKILTLPPTGRKKIVFHRFNHHRKLNLRCRCDKIIYCVARTWSELFQSRPTFSLRLKFPSRTSHTYYFLSHLCIHWSHHHGKGNTGWDLYNNNQTILQKQYFMRETIWFYLF